MESWDAASVVRVLDVWRSVLFNAVDMCNYKGDAFKGRITATAPAVEIIDLFLNSNQLSSQEKELYGRVRKMLLNATNHGPRDPADEFLIIPVSQAIGNDCASRGMELTQEMWTTGLTKVRKEGLAREKAMAATDALAKEFKVPKDKTGGSKGSGEKISDGAAAKKDLDKDKTDTSEEKKPNDTSKASDFGGTFRKNLRRAFG
ncbi:hypothetical protein H2200_003243 [Cladophialophora chaetospira]|uniref:Uncharacterized protein n=1 Tax=Cladophialophora chaetospira TaxID=386627 RepID=A0AA38XH69_9EURO|nr:hypothetical protein H2200_003243 [Cladophialophora chaetospira]